MNETNIRVTFSVIGENFDPSKVVDLLGIHPTESYIRGERIDNKDITWSESCWSYEFGPFINNLFCRPFDELIKKFVPLTTKIIQFNKDNGTEILIGLQTEIGNESAAFLIDNTIIQFLHDVRGELHQDLYILSTNGEDEYEVTSEHTPEIRMTLKMRKSGTNTEIQFIDTGFQKTYEVKDIFNLLKDKIPKLMIPFLEDKNSLYTEIIITTKIHKFSTPVLILDIDTIHLLNTLNSSVLFEFMLSYN